MTEDEKTIVDDLLDLEHGLTDREISFIDNLDKWYRNEPLTPKQSDWLKSIADRLL